MELKDKIKTRRLQLGLTLEDVAKAVGVSAPTIQRYESGEIKNMRRDKISSLADALQTTPAYLMGWEDDPNDCENMPEYSVPTREANKGTTPEMKNKTDMSTHDDIMREQALEEKTSLCKINPDIRMIARAGQKMTDKQAETLRKYAQFMFPEAFEEDE